MNRRSFLQKLLGIAAAAALPAWAIPKPEERPEDHTLEFRAEAPSPKTQFAPLTEEQKRVWAKSMWTAATRDSALISGWHSYAMTRDAGVVRLYLDGEPV